MELVAVAVQVLWALMRHLQKVAMVETAYLLQ
jgi:hypothetical protein